MVRRAAPRFRRSGADRREDILVAAFAEFALHGLDATRTAAIAQRAGISQPYIYALFTDKKALFLACHARAMARLRAALFNAALASDGPGVTSRALARVEEAFRDLVASDPTQLRFQLQAHAAASDPEIRGVVRERFVAMVDEGVRVTGASRAVVLEQLARGLFFSVALALDLPDDYRLPPAPETRRPPSRSNQPMSQLNDLPQGGQAQQAWAKPARSKAERRADVLRTLETENKLWIATASADGGAHLVPFSFVWDGRRVTMATSQDNPAARNAARTGQARLALGNFGDVVLIDGPLSVVQPHAIDDPLADRLARVSAIDGRRAPGFVYLQLVPTRIQAWWSGAELASPTVMRAGRWLD